MRCGCAVFFGFLGCHKGSFVDPCAPRRLVLPVSQAPLSKLRLTASRSLRMTRWGEAWCAVFFGFGVGGYFFFREQMGQFVPFFFARARTVVCHSCPSAHFHQTRSRQFLNTSVGLRSPFFSWFHSAAKSGRIVARSLYPVKSR